MVNDLTREQRRYLFLKRITDILIAAVAVVFLAIPMLLIALTLKILYPRIPVLFKQQRVGRNGELFTLIKFSSMRNEAVLGKEAQGSLELPKYVIGFGNFLRNSSLDELPQLFQVLSGKMSLIGPRPLVPQEKAVHILRWDSGVYRLRPGITGWAQVHGRDLLSDEKKAAYDKEYLEKMSFSLDRDIFLMTILQVVFRRGIFE